jgi:hypothetical protein
MASAVRGSKSPWSFYPKAFSNAAGTDGDVLDEASSTGTSSANFASEGLDILPPADFTISCDFCHGVLLLIVLR